ncbi:PTS system ascorbate-specific IIB component [Caldalkalibacillus uzonensis]|uniref:PTS system ascorbate-specific IIB component n=1 Tax=Caldalkalibacillus uzonensis TaxID=353224 RepID=A0ABU0CSD8_9BACI|nr:PTS sugar transporter subunit IIB [Caldalkalibacillus uzonensis]MDQ0339337.1 PTS system ascorbate-specific IIB component [Caldalkalibacillus uzonensis]
MKILAVCGLGQGTSLILRMNIEEVLNEAGVDAEVEHVDVSAASGVEADYILTSNELAQSLQGHQAKILVVNNYFDIEEIKRVLSQNRVI